MLQYEVTFEMLQYSVILPTADRPSWMAREQDSVDVDICYTTPW